MRTGRDGYVCAEANRDTAGKAAAVAARCKKLRRANFIDFSSGERGYQGRRRKHKAIVPPFRFNATVWLPIFDRSAKRKSRIFG